MSKSKHTPSAQPARHHINVLGQIIKFIPRRIIDQAARETGVDTKARSYSVLSHLGTMIFVQLAHALSLNDVCDWLRLKARAIAAFGVTPPSHNNLSNSNKVRTAKFAELVFWRSLAHLQHCDAGFGRRRPGGNAGRWEPRTPRGCLGSSRRARHLTGQHPLDLRARTPKPQLDLQHFRPDPPHQFKA